MKIEVLTPHIYGVGGIQRYSAHLVSALEDIGVEVKVIESKNTSFFGKISFVLRAAYAALIYKPDLIWVTQIGLGRVAIKIKKFSGVPYSLSAHGIEVWNLDQKGKRIAEDALKIAPVSRFTRDKILDQVPNVENKMQIIPNVAEELPKSGFKMRESLGISPEAKVILTVSRLSASEKYKGYDKIIQILPEILKEESNVFYVIAGDGDDRKRVEELAMGLGVKDRVVFAGEVKKENLRSFYEECNVFAMPSTGEGFGIVFLEALMSGKPVVAGNKDGSVDALLDGKLGILVDPNDTLSIKNGILEAFKNDAPLPPGELKNKAISEYGYEKFVKRVTEFLKNVKQ